MDAEVVLQIGREALLLAANLAAPLLMSALAIGLVVGLFQAATQIQEMTLSFIPKLIIMMLALILAGPWMVQSWLSFTTDLFSQIPEIIG